MILRFLPRPATVVVLACLLSTMFTPRVVAHPLEHHLQPLDDETVERVLDSLDQLVIQLENQGALNTARLHEGALGVAAMAAALEDAYLELQVSSKQAITTLNDLLADSGYADPMIGVIEWQLEAERVLETYEVLVRGLDVESLNAAFARYDEASARLSDEQALDQEIALFRDVQLLNTAGADVGAIEPYRARLDKLVQRLGGTP